MARLAAACGRVLGRGRARLRAHAHAEVSWRGPENRVWNFFPQWAETHQETALQVADSHLEKVGHGYEVVSGVHVYLYANADPVGRFDPSGNFTLVEVQTTQDVDAQLNRVAVPNARRILSLKLYNVYYGLQFGIPGHSAIFVGTKAGNAGWIFDVLPRQGAGYFDAIDGVIRRRPSTLDAFNRYCPTIHRKFTEFSNVEFIAWIMALRLVDAEDRSETPVSYQMVGFETLFNGATNCHKWALKSVLSALVVTRGQLKFQ